MGESLTQPDQKTQTMAEEINLHRKNIDNYQMRKDQRFACHEQEAISLLDREDQSIVQENHD